VPEERRGAWRHWIAQAVNHEPAEFNPNGWTVTALQAACSAIAHTPEGPTQYEEGIQAAIRIGNDTDTVAAIAGGLLGARWGVDAVPRTWRETVHGWPGWTCDELGRAALVAARL